MTGALKPGLLEILACPKCKEPVRQQGETLVCVNSGCGLVYPVRGGVPVMLIHEAQAPASQPRSQP